MIDHAPAQWKLKLVDSLVENIQNRPVIGLVSVHGVPGPQMQSIRAKLRAHLSMRVIKNTLLQIALEKAGEKLKGLDKLSENIDGQMALMLSDINPFKLYKLLEETKTKMPARGGEASPENIEIREGETSFKPGPIIGELQKAGVPAAIEKGKVVIKKDKVLVKQGEIISRELAQALTKLEIYPINVGLELRAAYEDGIVYSQTMLAIDQDEYLRKIGTGAASALNLAVFAVIPNSGSIAPLLIKAHGEAFNLAVNSGYPTKDSMMHLIGKANAQSISLASHLPPEALDQETTDRLSASAKKPEKPDDDEKRGEEEKKEKKDDDKKVSEEEAAAGLGALFG